MSTRPCPASSVNSGSPPAVAELYHELTASMAAVALDAKKAEAERASAEVEAVEAKLLRADEMYFEGDLEQDSCRRLKAKLKADLDRARQAFELAEALHDLFGSIVPEKVTFSGTIEPRGGWP